VNTDRRRSILVWVAAFAILAGLAWYLGANAGAYLELLRLSPQGVLSLFLLALAFPVVNGMINTYMFRGLGANITHWEGFLLAGTATLANQLPLPGGLVARGVYLKQRHGTSYSAYLSAAVALFSGSLAVYGFLGLAILLSRPWFEGPTPPLPLVIGFALMTASACLLLVPVDRLHLPDGLRGRLQQAIEGWTFIGRNPGMLLKLLSLQTGLMLLFAIRYWIAFGMLSQNISIAQALLLAASSILTQLITLAPGGLGVREAIVGGVAASLGFGLPVSVAAVGVDRLVSTVAIVVVGWYSTVVIGRRFSGPAGTSRA
jgi:uncharacterized membrane protein YbhN (UPF0104 family)